MIITTSAPSRQTNFTAYLTLPSTISASSSTVTTEILGIPNCQSRSDNSFASSLISTPLSGIFTSTTGSGTSCWLRISTLVAPPSIRTSTSF